MLTPTDTAKAAKQAIQLGKVYGHNHYFIDNFDINNNLLLLGTIIFYLFFEMIYKTYVQYRKIL